MKLKFLRDYQGSVTDNVFFKAGVYDVDDKVGKLYLDRAAVYVEKAQPCVLDKPEAKPKPKPAPKK